MFSRSTPGKDWAHAQALVLDKKVYASKEYSGTAEACRYTLRVTFEDGSTVDISRRAFGEPRASARVGDVVPVRHDPRDRSKIELDLGSPVPDVAADRDDRGQPDNPDLRVGDADRELIAGMLSEHMAEGRLTEEELESRLGVVYTSQTRGQARSVLADLPAPAPAGDLLPAWLRPPVPTASPPTRRPGGGTAGGLPTDNEMTRAYEAWQAKKAKVTDDKAAHKRAEAGGDKKETFLAFRKLTISRAEEKSARAKLEDLRKRRPDWTEAPAAE